MRTAKRSVSARSWEGRREKLGCRGIKNFLGVVKLLCDTIMVDACCLVNQLCPTLS